MGDGSIQITNTKRTRQDNVTFANLDLTWICELSTFSKVWELVNNSARSISLPPVSLLWIDEDEKMKRKCWKILVLPDNFFALVRSCIDQTERGLSSR